MRKTASLRSTVQIALFAALIAVCAQIRIPFAVPFTMQTFGVLLSVVCLGGKNGTGAFLVYLGLGLLGLPVFSGFAGGFAVFAGPTGGFLFGYLAGDLLLWLTEKWWSKTTARMLTGLFAALVCCYICGAVWYLWLYAGDLKTVLRVCIYPFVLPDLIKITLILPVKKRLARAGVFRCNG